MSAAKLFALFAVFESVDAATLPATHRNVLTCLANYEHTCGETCPSSCDKAGLAWPSRERIERFAGVSERTLKTVLADLRRCGWITVTPRYNADKTQTSNWYAVMTNGDPIAAPTKRGGARASCGGRGANIAPVADIAPVTGADIAPDRGAKMTPNPGLDPEGRSETGGVNTQTRARVRRPSGEVAPAVKPIAKTKPRATTKARGDWEPVDDAGAAEIAALAAWNPEHPVVQTVRVTYGGDYKRCSTKQLNFVRNQPKAVAPYDDAIVRKGIANVTVVEPPAKGVAIVIGREADCDHIMKEGDVSRHHLRVVGTDHGYLVTDLATSRGTRLGGTRIKPNDPTRVTRGCILVLGETPIRIGHPTAAMAAA